MSTRSTLLLIVLLGIITISLLTWFDEPDRVTITVMPSGLILVEGKESSLDDLEAIIRAYVEDDRTVEVVIMADDSIPVGDVLNVKVMAERSGVKHVEIVSDNAP